MDTSELIPKLEAAVPGAVMEIRPFGRSGEISLWVEMGAIRKLASFLRDEPTISFDWVENLSVIEVERALVLTYFLRSSVTGRFLIIRGSVLPETSESAVEVPSVSSIWASAEPFERDASELFGVRFGGQAIGRALLPPGIDGYPLRKDFTFPTEVMGVPHMRRSAATLGSSEGEATP